MEICLKICILLWLTINYRVLCSPTDIKYEENVSATDLNTPLAQQSLRLSKSAEIRNFMKPEVRPCDDFYGYACGNFGQIDNSSGKRRRTFNYNVLDTYDQKISKFLNNNQGSNETELVRKVKDFYESCLHRDKIRDNKRQEILKVLEEFGGMPAVEGEKWQEESFDFLKVAARILRKYGKSFAIRIEVERDFKNTTQNRLYIGELIMVPSKYENYYESLERMWRNDLEDLLGLTSSKALITAREMIEVAHQLSMGVSDPLDGMDIADKSELTNLTAMTDKYSPTLNLTAFVQTWLGYDYQEPVYEFYDRYLRNLKRVIEETPKVTLANYIMWQLANELNFHVYENEEDQQKYCVKETRHQFFHYIEHIMFQELKTSHPKIIEDALAMFQHIKLTYEQIFKSPQMNWMAEATRTKVLAKLSNLTLGIRGFANYNFTRELNSLTISSGSFYDNFISLLKLSGENLRRRVDKPYELNESTTASFSPMYLPDFNHIDIPVSYIQPMHLWEDAYPKAIQYGVMGYIIAHEMTHAFDDTARKYDASGNLHHWWDSDSNAIFETRKQCMRQQYSRFQHGKQFELEQNQDQSENIADVSGLHIAYETYEDWLTDHHQTPEHLPYMDTITSRQLFFIAAAQIWCSNDVGYMSMMRPHSPNILRVQGMISNSEAFAEVFECEEDSPMNPKTKCGIY